MKTSSATHSEPLLRQFWGKSTGAESYPAIYHMMDVALVAQQLLKSLTAKERDFILAPFKKSVSPESVYLFFIALHDIGKLTPEFQYMREDILEFDTELYKPTINRAKHGFTGLQFLVPYLKEKFPNLAREDIKLLVTFSVSHHGKFEFTGKFKKTNTAEDPWHDLKVLAVQWLLQQFSLDWQQVCVDVTQLNNAWIVYNSGLCCVADWIGSDKHPDRFPYNRAQSYQTIYGDRKSRAEKAVKSLNLKALFYRGKIALSFQQVFGFPPRSPQKKAQDIASQKNPSFLTIIETEMGSGKTESAFYLAERLLQSGHSNGFYVAMPSQATANQLFHRTLAFLENHPENFHNVETHLMHGNAELSDKYLQLQAASVGEVTAQHKDAAVAASSWFCSRKTGLLASCAVGTIDQLLMAGLNIRHNFVRLFGLAGRTVILDEVHSLDAYQTHMLENLLSWLALLRCPVVILSATLPKGMRLRLMQAYSPQDKVDMTQIDVPYPRISWFNEHGKATACSFASEMSTADIQDKQIVLHQAAHHQIVPEMTSSVLIHLQQTGGQDVLVCIVNTVGEAQELYKQLRQQVNESWPGIDSPPDTTRFLLFHSRFMLGDKLNIEDSIETLIGPNKNDRKAVNPSRPHAGKGLVLIGTQVLEQSLNFDASVMFTACPPIDLLLQRMGRLHRFVVNNNVRQPCFKIPKIHTWLAQYDADKALDAYAKYGASGLIYPEYILARTSAFLSCESDNAEANGLPLTFNAMRDMDRWIEAVYGDVSELSPDSTEAMWEQRYMFRHEQKTMANLADKQLFKAKQDTEGLIARANNILDEDDIKISTRLASRSVTLIFVQRQQDGWCTCFGAHPCLLQQQKDLNSIKHLKQSGININNPFWVDFFTADTYQPNLWQQRPEQKLLWRNTPLLYGSVLVCLDKHLSFCEPTVGKLWLDPETGLCWQLNNKKGGDGINAV